MSSNENGPPKEVETGAPHHQDDWRSTNSFSSHDTADTNKHILFDEPCRCRRCGRVLTAPLSVSVGAGPVCRRHLLDEELCNAIAQFTDALVVA